MEEDEESGQLDHYKTKSTVQPSLVTSNWNSRLIPITSDSLVHLVLLKSDFSYSISDPTIKTLIPTKCRELLERILREKLQRKTRLIYPQFYILDSPNSSTLILSIVIPIRGSQTKSLSHLIQSSEKVFSVWEAVQEKTKELGEKISAPLQAVK